MTGDWVTGYWVSPHLGRSKGVFIRGKKMKMTISGSGLRKFQDILR